MESEVDVPSPPVLDEVIIQQTDAGTAQEANVASVQPDALSEGDSEQDRGLLTDLDLEELLGDQQEQVPSGDESSDKDESSSS